RIVQEQAWVNRQAENNQGRINRESATGKTNTGNNARKCNTREYKTSQMAVSVNGFYGVSDEV
ncbi:MAG: hypothetical protein ACRC4X_07085, partial [Cetobacterium sp.]